MGSNPTRIANKTKPEMTPSVAFRVGLLVLSFLFMGIMLATESMLAFLIAVVFMAWYIHDVVKHYDPFEEQEE